MRWFRIIAAGCHCILNGALALVLAGLLFLVTVLWREDEIPIPASVLEALDRELAEDGFRIEAKDIQFDLRGMVLAHDVRVYSTENSESFFDAEVAFAQLSWLSLLFGEISLTEVAIADGEFYCPAVVSPAGKRESIVKNIHVDLSRTGRKWTIETFIFELLDARVRFAGSAFTPFPGLDHAMDAGVDPDAETDFVGAYLATCRSLLEVKETLELFQDPILQISVSSERRGPLRFSAHVYNQGFIDEGNELRLGAGTARIDATLGEDGVLRSDGMGRAWLNSLRWTDEVSTGYTEATIALDDGLEGFARIPRSAELYCYNIQAWGLPFDGAFALVNLEELQENPGGHLTGQVRMKSGSDWLAVSGAFKPSDQSGRLELAAEWNPEFFLKSTAISAEAVPKGIDIIGQPRWQAAVDFDPGLKPVDAHFDVRFGKLSYESIDFLAAHAKGRLTESEVDLYEVDLMGEGYRVEGNYWQNMQTGDYRFQAYGDVWPQDLDVVIDEDWWTELWREIEFRGVPASAEIDMSGRFGGGASKRKIYGSATLKDVTYRGVEVDRAFARIWQAPKSLDLFDFTLATPEGRATVGLHWNYLPGQVRHFLSFRARTDMPLEQAATLAAPEAMEYVKMFPAKRPPTLDVAGLVYGEGAAAPDDLYLKASAFFPEDFQFEEIYFSNGSFVCLLTPEALDVSEGRFSLGQGKASMNANLDRGPGGALSVKRAMINIRDAKLWGLYETIPFLREARAEQVKMEAKRAQETGAPLKPFKQQYAGTVNFHFETRGELPELDTFVGSGMLAVEGANLGELHLLGGLSRFLFENGLPLGTLEFSNAKSQFTLARGNINFPDLEITGQTGLIDANGNFNLDASTLDFMITLRPFGNVQTPVFAQVIYVFSPISDLIEVELTGTLLEPNYVVTVQPLSMLTGQKKVPNPNAEVSTSVPSSPDSVRSKGAAGES